jgi:hypothetical protein
MTGEERLLLLVLGYGIGAVIGVMLVVLVMIAGHRRMR